MAAIPTFRRNKAGRVSFSIWRNGIWLTRLAAVLALMVFVFAVIDIRLLMTPVAEVFGVGAVVGGLFGIALCLYGVNRRSKRLRLRGFWGSVVGGTVLVVAVGLVYLRAFHSPRDQATPVQLAAP